MQLYNEVYERIFIHTAQTGQAVVKNTFKWLLSAQSSMKTWEFLAAMSTISAGIGLFFTKDNILDLCGNFVVVNRELDMFRFAHLSV